MPFGMAADTHVLHSVPECTRPDGWAERDDSCHRTGGTVVVLELGEPVGPMAPLARFHVHHVVPRLGAWLSGNAEYDDCSGLLLPSHPRRSSLI